MKRLPLALMLVSCINARDVDDGEAQRRRAANALSARVTFDNGERAPGFPLSNGGPTISALEIALGLRAGQPFDVTVNRTSAPFSSLLIAIENADEHVRVDTRSQALGFISLREGSGAELNEARLLIAALGDDGRVGPPLALPFVVQEGGGPTAGARAQLFVGDPASVEALDFNDGVLVAGDERGVVSRWEDAVRTLRVEAHEGPIFDVRCFGQRFYSAGADAVRAFDGEMPVWQVPRSARAMDANESHVVFGDRDGVLHVLDSNGTEIRQIALDFAITDIDIMDDGQRAAVALGRLAVDGGLRVVDVSSGELLLSEDLPRGASAIATREEWVVVAVGAEEVHLFDLSAARPFQRVQELPTTDIIEDLVFSGAIIGAMTLSGQFVFFRPDGRVVIQERFTDETYALDSDGDDIAFGDRRGAIWRLDGVTAPRAQ